MVINRERYVNDLIARRNDGLIKVVTGIRRCGKSFLLFRLFRDYLLSVDVKASQIIPFAFDNDEDLDLIASYYPDEPTKIYLDNKRTKYVVNAKKFRAYIKEKAVGETRYYLLLDEVQLLDDFVGTLNGFLRHDNYDIYVTGSNSRFLSKDVATEFRARGEQIHVNPLSFSEFFSVYNGSFDDAFEAYSTFGGLPYVATLADDSRKVEYLRNLLGSLYQKDVVDRYDIESVDSLGVLMDILASNIGSFTNPTKIETTFQSLRGVAYHHDTIARHLGYLEDCFLIEEAKRFNVKGRKYIGANSKYYWTDIGLRNALLRFRQQEPTHILENVIYNELRIRGYEVDVGIVEAKEKNEKGTYATKQYEVDFVCNLGNEKVYIQSAYALPDRAKRQQETRSLSLIRDSFRKIVVVRDSIKPWSDENGVLYLGLRDFLLNRDALR
ncbi:MAG: ATP-binding protein [Bacilli bacterium]|nr:ATP-binding protein [Bacilli bacterium]